MWRFWSLVILKTVQLEQWVGNWCEKNHSEERGWSPGNCRVRESQKAEPGKT